jgi:hypothetical protein
MSGIFGNPQAKTTPAITTLKVQTSSYGKVIPVTYGRTRITFNLLWFNNFTIIPPGGKGK